jgi:AsmA family protein
MDGATAHPAPHGHPLWLKVLVGIAVLVALLALLLVFFPWDVLRGPLNRYVSDKTGRHFEITRRLDVKLGRTTRILADGIEFANPDWARDPLLVKAQGAEIDVELLPLLRRKYVLPLIKLNRPELGLQIEPDGRRSWALGRDTKDPSNLPDIGALAVDEGTVHFVDSAHGADIRTEFAIDGALPMTTPANGAKTATAAAAPSSAASASGTAPAPGPQTAALPLRFTAKGTWDKQPFSATGRTGNVLTLSAPLQQPFPAEIDVSAAGTTLHAHGSVSSLATLEGADAQFSVQGHDLQDLYRLVGIVMPSTPRYSLQGNVSKQGDVWHIRDINGKLGASDLRGELAFDRSQNVPLLTGKLQTKSLDFDDLAPLVGLPEQAHSAAALPQVKGDRPRPAPTASTVRGGTTRVLPTAALDLERLHRMNADVTYDAAKISNVKQLPIDRLNVHVRLNDGMLQLDPLKVGIAGGSMAGRMRINGNSNPAVAETHLDARSLEFNKLFPGVKVTKASFGKLAGNIDLKGRGNTVAQMLGSSNGEVALLMGSGEISEFLVALADLDGGQLLKLLASGDKSRQVPLRCAAAAFDVKSGVMNTRAFVLDTTQSVIYGDGKLSLADESMDLTFRPYPKDMSVLSLRSPLHVTGNFAKPKLGPDMGALAGRAGVALAAGALNPLLALVTTLESGPGKDANCGPALQEAASPYQAARIAVMSQPQQEKDGGKKPGLLSRILGGGRSKQQQAEQQQAQQRPQPEQEPQPPALAPKKDEPVAAGKNEPARAAAR